eukprot:1209820-Amphidinium_carterae.1
MRNLAASMHTTRLPLSPKAKRRQAYGQSIGPPMREGMDASWAGAALCRIKLGRVFAIGNLPCFIEASLQRTD